MSWALDVKGANPSNIEQELNQAATSQNPNVDELSQVQMTAVVKGIVAMANDAVCQSPINVYASGHKGSDGTMDSLNISINQGYEG